MPGRDSAASIFDVIIIIPSCVSHLPNCDFKPKLLLGKFVRIAYFLSRHYNDPETATNTHKGKPPQYGSCPVWNATPCNQFAIGPVKGHTIVYSLPKIRGNRVDCFGIIKPPAVG